jgi:hypothetical protein
MADLDKRRLIEEKRKEALERRRVRTMEKQTPNTTPSKVHERPRPSLIYRPFAPFRGLPPRTPSPENRSKYFVAQSPQSPPSSQTQKVENVRLIEVISSDTSGPNCPRSLQFFSFQVWVQSTKVQAKTGGQQDDHPVLLCQ